MDESSHVGERKSWHIDGKNPPPRGGFLFTMFPDQELRGRGSHPKNHPQDGSFFLGFWGWFFRWGPLAPGSWFGNHPTDPPPPPATKKPPRGGVFFWSRSWGFDKLRCWGLGILRSWMRFWSLDIWMRFWGLDIWMSQVSRLNESRSCIWVTWPIHMCDSCANMDEVLRSWHMDESCSTFKWVTVVYMGDMTHSYVWLMCHDSSIYATRVMNVCDMTHLNVWHDSSNRQVVSVCRFWVYYWGHSHVWHDSFICV